MLFLFSIKKEKNKVSTLPPNKTKHGVSISCHPQLRSKILFIACKPHRIGDIKEIVFNETGNISIGTHTPPIAESITTEMAATGNA